MTIPHPLSVAVLVVSIGLAACDVRVSDKGVSLDVNEGGRAEDESTRTYPLAEGGRLDLDVDDGDLELVAAAGPAVEVRLRRTARARNDEAARALLAQDTVAVESAPDRLVIRSRSADRPPAMRRAVRIDYRIAVPAGAIVSARNANGRIRLTDVAGRYTVASTNGRIEGRGVSGALDLQTVNGGISMELAAVTGDVRITTVNGGVTLDLPPTANATVEATTVNGGVQVHDSLPLVATTRDRQRLAGRLGAGTGPRIELQTTNGGVRLGGKRPPA